ncbi:MAG: ATP-binding protein [Planctomycetota bacterium]|nr:ATP-binding protein [Planctomycetota bacterium]MDA1214240.1 ATP-binding protein [Planctomycetota bacterium]
MTKPTLLVIQGSNQGARYGIETVSLDIGRGVRNTVRIHDTEVSRHHATLEANEGIYQIVDRNSSNGTFVNGVAVRTRRLHDGDLIQIGRTILLFTEQSASPEMFDASHLVNVIDQGAIDDRSHIIESIDARQERLLGRGLATTSVMQEQTLAHLQVLYRISEEVVRPSMSLEQMLKRILDLTIDAVGADRACLLLSDPQTGQLGPVVYTHRHGVQDTGRMPVSQSIVDVVILDGRGVRTSDAQSDRRFVPGQSILQAGIREAMCVPMKGHFELIGVVYVDITTPAERVLANNGNSQHFEDGLLSLLASIGRQTALAIENSRYQHALIKAERLATMGETIATLSHHIKNILQGIRGGSYLIDMGLNDHNEDVVRKGWDIVEKNQNKIYNLVMDMLTFSKERQPAWEPANANDIVKDIFELMQARAAEKNIQFEAELDPEMPETPFDPEGISRAILNVVTNAFDAIEDVENATVLVQTTFAKDTGNVQILVTDNGHGIPEETLPHIFNAFESTKGARGTGLGLAVSQKIIMEHGGRITVDSKPGSGCRFALTWPGVEEENRSIDGQTQA